MLKVPHGARETRDECVGYSGTPLRLCVVSVIQGKLLTNRNRRNGGLRHKRKNGSLNLVISLAKPHRPKLNKN